MTREEFEQVFTALGLFWPREPVTDKRRAAWWLAMEPYPYYGGVRDRIIEYARSAKGNYFPDVADLTAGLERETASAVHTPDWIDEALEKQPSHTANPVTRYASRRGITIGAAEAELGTSREAAGERGGA